MFFRLNPRAIGVFALGVLVVLTAQFSASKIWGSPLKVMSFNVWTVEGTLSARNKLAQIITAGDADIVGLQEMTSSAGKQIANQLGYHYYQQSGGDIQVLSRFPIVGHSAANYGVRIQFAEGEEAWLFNAHLSAFPYQPYDLRDGLLPMNEASVIAASNDVRGSEVTAYLNDMSTALGSGLPIFFTGDFNEPSHLDWSQAAALATPRTFDLKVEYPTSKRIVDAGMVDSFRAVRPDEVSDPAYTWTPGTPPPTQDVGEVFDRIDFIYHAGAGVNATSAFTIGYDDSDPYTDVEVPGYNSDHRAVVVEYTLPYGEILLGDFDGNNELNAADWQVLRGNQLADLSGLTTAESFARGDLNGDLRNNHIDFVVFKNSYEREHGVGSFATLLSQVPEPNCLFLMTVLSLTYLARNRGFHRPCGPSTAS